MPRRRYRPSRRKKHYFTSRRRQKSSGNRGLLGLAVAIIVIVLFIAPFIARNPIVGILIFIAIVGIAVIRRTKGLGFALFRGNRSASGATLSDFYALTPTQFEDAVGDLLQTLGYRDVRRVGGAGDLAADLRCRDADGRSVVVQCKRYGTAGSIGSPVMQSFIGMAMIHHHADRAIFVTTSYFTAAAADLGQRHGVTLIDGKELIRLSTGGSIRTARNLT